MRNLKDGIELRPLTIADADAVYACAQANADRFSPWFNWMNDEYSVESVRSFLHDVVEQPEPRSDMVYGFWSGQTFAGSIGLHKIDYTNRIARIGYWIDRHFEGRGLVTLAVKELVSLAFGALNLNRIEIRCAPQNAASRAIPARLGFVEEGTNRQVLALHGGFQDLVMYAMLAKDWRA